MKPPSKEMQPILAGVCVGLVVVIYLALSGNIDFLNDSTSSKSPQAEKQANQTGLSEFERKHFYTEWVLAEDKATTWEKVGRESYAHSELDYELLDQFQQELLDKYNLTKDQAYAICGEAFEKNWPMPEPVTRVRAAN